MPDYINWNEKSRLERATAVVEEYTQNTVFETEQELFDWLENITDEIKFEYGRND